jgi:peptidyl-prolyl cis-trans isomerase D
MRNAAANKMSYFILTFIFLIIIASFLFSGFDKFSLGGGRNVATVDGTPISIREYQVALNRQVEFFNQMMGGKGMTSKQLEEMGIKQSVLNGLIQQKLIHNTAENMGIVVSLEEVKQEIKNLPYFQRNKQFDVSMYRNVLQANGYTPGQFEDLIANDLKQKKVDSFFDHTVVSQNFAKDVTQFKNNSVNVNAIRISRQSLAPLIAVSQKEIDEYLSNPANQATLENAYTENLTKYKQPEEVRARHILVQGDDAKALEKIKAIQTKTNTRNFSEIANRETEDPSGKNKGGDLGWFSRGRMVPEFEEVAFNMKPGQISDPVKTQFGYHLILVEDRKAAQSKTLEEVKPELAAQAIQRTKAQDLEQLMESERVRVTNLMKENKIAELDKLQKQLDAQLHKGTEVNQFEQTIGSVTLSAKEMEEIFKASSGDVLNLGNPGTIFVVRVNSSSSPKPTTKSNEELKAELVAQNQAFSRKVREEFIRSKNNQAKVVTNPSLM